MTASQHRSRRLGRAALATTIAVLCAQPGRGQIEITTATGNTAQNFDTLVISGTNQAWTNDTTVALGDSTLNGWSLFNSVNNAITTYNAGTGGSNTGNFYSFGFDTSATERALGGTASGGAYFGNPATGAVAGHIAFAAVNSSPATLTSFTVGFDGEQWRDGGATTPVAQSMVLQYGFGTAFTDVTTWNEPGGNFNWASPVFVNTTTGAAVNGNVAGLAAGRGGTINGLNWTTGQTLWVRWIERNDGGNDHGLAIDNFTLSWTGATIVPLYWDVDGATPGIGGTGVWSATNVANVNWNPNAAGDGTPQNSDANKRLIFGGAGGVITIDTSVAANIGMEFDASYMIDGGVLTLGNIPTIDADGTVTISSAVAGTAGLTKLGPGTLILTNPNNPFEGTITISTGALSVGADGSLGNAGNDIALGGGLLAFSNGFALAAGRNLTGSGVLRIPAGQTVTAQGTVNLGAIEIGSGDVEHDEGGTLALTGATNTIGSLTLSDPAVITSPTGIALGGNVTVATSVIGSSRITSPVSLTSGVPKFTIPDTPATVDFLIDGILSGSGKLHKVGAGALRLVGVNTTFPGGVRLGTAGTTQEPGGRLIIGDKSALGTTALDFQFNDGTLQAEVALTGANALSVGVSLGAGQLGPATFTGQPMEFLGDLSLFRPALTTIEHKIVLETDVVFRGFAVSQSTGTSTGLLISGATVRTLTFSGTGATISTEVINLDGPTLVVNGALTGATVNVRSGTLRGAGPLGGILTIGDSLGENDATFEPDDGIGPMNIGGLTLLSDARVRFELDLVTLTNDKLMADGPVDLGLGVASVEFVFINPTTVPLGTAFTLIDNSALGGTTGNFDGLPQGTTFNFAGNQFTISYTAGPEFNDVVLSAIPEPATTALLALGALAFGRRRRAVNVTAG